MGKLYTKKELRDAWRSGEACEAFWMCKEARDILMDSAFSADDEPLESEIIDAAYWSKNNER